MFVSTSEVLAPCWKSLNAGQWSLHWAGILALSPNLCVFIPLRMLSSAAWGVAWTKKELFLAWTWGPWGFHEGGEGTLFIPWIQWKPLYSSSWFSKGEWRARDYLRLTLGFNGAEWGQREPETPCTPMMMLGKFAGCVALSSQWKLGKMLWEETGTAGSGTASMSRSLALPWLWLTMRLEDPGFSGPLTRGLCLLAGSMVGGVL